MLDNLPKKRFGAIYCDPPWHFKAWSKYKDLADGSKTRATERHYSTMSIEEIMALPVAEVAADDCVLFIWACWPMLMEAIKTIDAWGFTYKTCAFDWMKAHAGQVDMFREDLDVSVGLGFWSRSNSEPCLLATRGKPKRLNADVRMGIIEPRREHSRKPNCVHGRIERLVGGPYLELFARTSVRPNWTFWGNQTEKFNEKVTLCTTEPQNQSTTESNLLAFRSQIP